MDKDPDNPTFEYDEPIPAEFMDGDDDDERSGLPWENRHIIGFFPAIFETIKDILLSPHVAFRRMAISHNMLDALGFFYLISFPVLIISTAMSLATNMTASTFINQMTGNTGTTPMVLQGAGSLVQFIMIIIAAPILQLVSLFIITGMAHIILLIWPGNNRGFATTFRVYCYAYGTVSVLALIPVCGGCIQSVWGIVACIFGLLAAHETDGMRASGAVLIPMLFCCMVIAIPIILFFFFVASAVGSGGGNPFGF
jgi:hypothetical protein